VSLTHGSRVGRYEIQALLGAGGMGEVYLAHDEKLGREVAIKMLPAAFANDGERLARFEREAKVLASLNHPNIAAIYEIAESNGVPALILELIEGDTLEDRLASGFGLRASGSESQRDSGSGLEPKAQSPKPDRARPKGPSTEEALRMAMQIADALEAAHERGIVHRDLKPANIKLTASVWPKHRRRQSDATSRTRRHER
jgi:serine/threonine protein kinase